MDTPQSGGSYTRSADGSLVQTRAPSSGKLPEENPVVTSEPEQTETDEGENDGTV